MGIELLGVLSSADHLIFMPSTFLFLYLFLFSSLSTPWKVVYDMEWWERNQREYYVKFLWGNLHVVGLKKREEKRREEKRREEKRREEKGMMRSALSLYLLFLINLVMHCSASLPSIFSPFASRFDLCRLLLPSLHISQRLKEHWERRE